MELTTRPAHLHGAHLSAHTHGTSLNARMSSIVAPAAALAPRAAVRASRSRVASSRSVAFSPANVRATRPRPVSLAAKPKEKDVDWDAKTKEMTAERIMESCLEAMADGDENQLEACLLRLLQAPALGSLGGGGGLGGRGRGRG